MAYSGRHMFGLGTVHATFTVRCGELRVADPPNASTVAVTVDATSFHSNSAKRDKDVRGRGRGLLDVDTYPDITFVSDALRQDGDRWLVAGRVTAHGSTVPVEVVVRDVHPEGEVHWVCAPVSVSRDGGLSPTGASVSRAPARCPVADTVLSMATSHHGQGPSCYMGTAGRTRGACAGSTTARCPGRPRTCTTLSRSATANRRHQGGRTTPRPAMRVTCCRLHAESALRRHLTARWTTARAPGAPARLRVVGQRRTGHVRGGPAQGAFTAVEGP